VRHLILGTCLALTLASIPPLPAAVCDAHDRFTLLVHGGFMGGPEEVQPEHLELIDRVVRDGVEGLRTGRPALDVVVDAIAAMEDSGILDAGKGSYFNTAGFVENDASLMEGHTGSSGAVAAMQQIRNPIRAARIVMDATPHILFVGTTGEETLVGLGAETVDDPASYFKEYLPPVRRREGAGAEHGTVGAVALDRCGHLAAGTSTGGTYAKMPGRVGDSPIIGASTFANERYALSATGVGENFIQRAATRDIAMRAEYLGQPLREAADHVIKELIGEADGVEGAIIAIDLEGEIVLSSNGWGILYGWGRHEGGVSVGAELQ
jgi:isoaspartyl peptidase/L-asparaginase-like protein (Ntn-hydrolase superfamily)